MGRARTGLLALAALACAACSQSANYTPAFGYPLQFQNLPKDLYRAGGDLDPGAMQNHMYAVLHRVASVEPPDRGSLPLTSWRPDGPARDVTVWGGQWNTKLGSTPPPVLDGLPAGARREDYAERAFDVRYWTEIGADALHRGRLYLEIVAWTRNGSGERLRVDAPDVVHALFADVIRAIEEPR